MEIERATFDSTRNLFDVTVRFSFTFGLITFSRTYSAIAINIDGGIHRWQICKYHRNPNGSWTPMNLKDSNKIIDLLSKYVEAGNIPGMQRMPHLRYAHTTAFVI